MTIAAWPSDVNQNVDQDGFSEAPERNVISFQPEVGPPIERRRTSISSSLCSFTQYYSSAEYDSLVTFYRTTLLDGVLTFTRNHPRTGVSATFKFVDAPKLVQAKGGIVFVVAHNLRLMP